MAPGLLAWGLIACGVLAEPARGEISRDHFSLYVTFTTDYVYRGLSGNDEEPALQLGLDFEHPSGFFAGIWASDTEIPPVPPATEPRENELDLYAGWAQALGRDWSAAVTGTLYTYPDSDPVKSYDYFEGRLSVHFRDRASFAVAHSENIQGTGEPATAYEGAVRLPLPREIDLDLGYGWWDAERWIGEGYAYWSAGLSRALGRWVLSVDYIDTDSTAERIFRDGAGERVAFGVTFNVF